MMGVNGAGKIYKVLLIDDEEDTLLEINCILSKDPRLQIVGAFTDPVKAFEQACHTEIHCAFIDIKMPVINGFELGERLMQYHPDLHIVYVTAYNDYAAEAFEINAVDYVLKPVRKERLYKAVDKIIAKIPANLHGDKSDTLYKVLCFGKLELSKEENPLQWHTKKSMELFAYLLYHKEKFMSKEIIIDDLWPEYEYENALINLNTSIYRTRKTLECLNNRIRIEYKNNSYCMQMQDVYYDVDEFDRAYDQSKRFPDQRITLLQKAFTIYRGDYLEENAYIWCIDFQENLRRKYTACLKTLASYYLSNRDPDHSIMLLETAIGKNPYDCKSYDLLFEAYRLKKDVYPMLVFYEKTNEKLYETLDIDISQYIKELFFKSYRDITGKEFKCSHSRADKA